MSLGICNTAAPTSSKNQLHLPGLTLLRLLGVAALGLAGCGMSTVSSHSATPAAAALSGRVHGGQQPIVGAIVSLVAPGTTGYGSAGTVIAVSAPTDTGGGFTLPRPYTCPAHSGLVYLRAAGGDAGAGVNSAIAEAAIVGDCNSLAASSFFTINEVTTVAAAYTLAPFAAVVPGVGPALGSTNIGTSPGNLQGLYNAVSTAANLVNPSTGLAHAAGELTGIVPPTAELNTLADILSACVNQGTTSLLPDSCNTLFTAAAPQNSSAPTDTFQAAVDIAQAPGRNVSPLYGLVYPASPFQPTLTARPNDFSLALGFNGGAISAGAGTLSIAIDAVGDAWLTTGAPSAVTPVHTITEISPAGVYLSGSGTSGGYATASLSSPAGISVDQSGYVYVANKGDANLLKLNPDGTINTTITAQSFSAPNAVALDALGDQWIANAGSAQVTEITPLGVEATNSPFLAGSAGVDIAVGPLAVWQTDSQSQSVYRSDLSTHAVTSIHIGTGSGDIGIDHANNVWIASDYGTIFEITDAGGNANTPTFGYGRNGTFIQNVAVDGLGNIFAGAITNDGSPGSLLELSHGGTLLSPGTGYTGSGFVPAIPEVVGGTAIDGSGNVWMAGTHYPSSLPDYVAEIIGIAAPVVTPKSVATTTNTLGTRP